MGKVVDDVASVEYTEAGLASSMFLCFRLANFFAIFAENPPMATLSSSAAGT